MPHKPLYWILKYYNTITGDRELIHIETYLLGLTYQVIYGRGWQTLLFTRRFQLL